MLEELIVNVLKKAFGKLKKGFWKIAGQLVAST